jgi:phage baseplate assembly protein W
MITKEYAAEHPEEYLGRDVSLNIYSDIGFDYTNDLSTARYDANLTQAIIHRLQTGIGEDALHPNYGSRLFELIGTTPDDLSLPTAKMHTREALLQEPRITEVISIVPTWGNDDRTVIELNLTVKPLEDLATLNLIYEVFI